jgi:hypothetical protein
MKKHKLQIPTVLHSVADPGCFIPDPAIFSSRIRIQTFFHPESYMKSGMQTNLFLASYAFRSSHSLSHSQKDTGSEIRDPEKIHPGSRG